MAHTHSTSPHEIAEDFIGIYPASLSKKQCQFLINLFEKYQEEFGHEGATSGGVQKEIKNTRDLSVRRDQNKYLSAVNKSLRNILWQYVSHYARKYQFLGDLLRCDAGFQIQKYKKGTTGYLPHPDNNNDFSSSSNRSLVFMWYLNDVEHGGETHFPLYNKYVKPKAGTLVFFPPYWTHLHQAMPPLSTDKYIITNWIYNLDIEVMQKVTNIYKQYEPEIYKEEHQNNPEEPN